MSFSKLSNRQDDYGNFSLSTARNGISDEMCLNAARVALRFGADRAIPIFGAGKESRYAPRPRKVSFLEGKSSPGLPGSLPATSTQLRVADLRAIRVQDSIWSKAARSGKLDTPAALSRIGRELLGAPPAGEIRSSLQRDISHTAILLLGDFPHRGGVRFENISQNPSRQALQRSFRLLDTKFSRLGQEFYLHFVIFPHFGNYERSCFNTEDWYARHRQGIGAALCKEFFDDALSFQHFIDDQNKRLSSLHVHFFRVSDWRNLAEVFVNVLSRQDSNAILLR